MASATTQLTPAEWLRRYAARIAQEAGMSESESMQAAVAAAESEEYFARRGKREPDWSDPEGRADDEMSYWEP